nr:MAG TPA: hypothetical protein [Caudoviricetes sp.]
MKAVRGLTNLKEIFFYYEKRCYQLEPLSIPFNFQEDWAIPFAL